MTHFFKPVIYDPLKHAEIQQHLSPSHDQTRSKVGPASWISVSGKPWHVRSWCGKVEATRSSHRLVWERLSRTSDRCRLESKKAQITIFRDFPQSTTLFGENIFSIGFSKWSMGMRTTLLAVRRCPTGHFRWRRWAWTHACWSYSMFLPGVTRTLVSGENDRWQWKSIAPP